MCNTYYKQTTQKKTVSINNKNKEPKIDLF